MAPSPHENDASSGGGDRRKHVLIVEDDPINARVLADYLAAHGYRTSVASTGPEGLAMFEASRPDLALVDVLLPRINGFEVCFAIKRSGRPTPVVLMSAVYERGDQAEELRAALSAQAFLRKPFELDVLLDRVRTLVGDA